MPNLNVNKPTPNRHPKSANKLSDEKQRMVQEHHERMQRMIYQDRKKEIDLIRPQEEIRLLRIKHAELENARGPARPNLKQNVKQHVDTLYAQEAKYLGERAELYKTNIYNPYLLKQYVETVKVDAGDKPVAYLSNGVGGPSQKEVYVTPQEPPMNTRPHRPTLFADQVFHDYNEVKRAPLESVLTNPHLSAHPKVQENGFYHQQSTYGGSYNTKKFLQENELLSNEETFYQRLHPDEIEGQNVVLKSQAEQYALANYKNGLTESPADTRLANQMLEAYAKEVKEIEYPRVKGPVPPEPYETIYCAKEITEHSDGNSKRYYKRVYDSPYEPTHPRFEVYKPDVEAIEAYNQKLREEQADKEKERKRVEEEYAKYLPRGEFSLSASQDKVARRELDKAAKLVQDQNKMKSVYANSYTPYHYENAVKCPPNQFYKGIEYTQNPSGHARLNNESVPDHLLGLQDGWSKSMGNARFHSAHENRSPDLRQDVQEGKRIVKESPANAYKYV